MCLINKGVDGRASGQTVGGNKTMSKYGHATFFASTAKQFRSNLIAAIRKDLMIDADEALENIRDGVIRHGVWVNGRHIGYEAVINQNGDIQITKIKTLDLKKPYRRAAKTMEQLRAEAESHRAIKSFLSGDGAWGNAA